MTFAPVAWVYFTVGLATLAITGISRNLALVFGAVVMLASWLVSNEVLTTSGYSGLIAHDAVVAGVSAIAVAWVGRAAHNRALAIVFALFALNVAVDVATLALIYHMAMNVTRGVTIVYVGTINAIYLASCLVLGVSGVGTRLAVRGDRRHPDRSRGWSRGPAVVERLARGKPEA